MQAQQCVQSSGTNHPNGLTILLIPSRKRFRNASMRGPRGDETSGFRMLADLVAIAEWKYPFPSRTRKSSALTPMVLHSCGRVGSRQVFFYTFACMRRSPSSLHSGRTQSTVPRLLLGSHPHGYIPCIDINLQKSNNRTHE